MSVAEFDVVVIGGGPAGCKAALQGAQAGRRVLLVDRQRLLGGECVHRGTIPSKTLHDSACRFLSMRRESAALVGTHPSKALRVDALMQRLDSVRETQAQFMDAQLASHGVQRWRGRARFVSEHEIAVESPGGKERIVRSDVILVATGSRPRTPDNVPVDHENILDSDSVLSLIYLPSSMTVLGAGVIACEYASIFAALGVKVTMIDRGARPLGFLDEELTQHFLEDFTTLGGTFLAERNLESVHVDVNSDVVTRLDSGEEIRSEKLLCALGRVTCATDLGIAEAGVELNGRGVIQVDEHYRTRVPHIFAAGDAAGSPALAAAAMEQGRIAMCAALGLETHSTLDSLPAGIYTVPEMACVGLTEAQAIEEHGAALVGRAPFSEIARGQISGDTNGLLKLVATPDGKRIVGAHIVGHGAVELIHLAQMAMLAGAGPEIFIENTFNFPTLAEGYRIAALQIDQAIAGRLRKAS